MNQDNLEKRIAQQARDLFWWILWFDLATLTAAVWLRHFVEMVSR